MSEDKPDRDDKGHFLPGNKFWEARSSHGRKPSFESPDQLWSACVEYFNWVDENPLYEKKAFAFQGVVTTTDMPKMRAMTVSALCLFLGITRETWGKYREKPEFSDICAGVDEVIRAQKFEGASADLLNASIIARDLGLANKEEHSGSVTVNLPNGIEKI